MDFIDSINMETLIICSKNDKKMINELHILKPIKVMTMDEFIKNYFYDYNENAIIYLMNEYKINYEIAKEYIDNTYYVNDIKYGVNKLDFLVDLKHKLIDNNLLIYNSLFIDYLRRVNIIIYDIEMDQFYLDLFKGFKYQIIKREYQNYNHVVYKFDTTEDEVYFVVNEICKLIDMGISPKKIKLANVNSDYYNMVNRIFSLYNLKVNINYSSLLISYNIVKEFIKRYKSNEDIREILEDINDNSTIYHELVKVLNEYLIYDNKELLIYKIEHATINNCSYDLGIDLIDYLDYQSNTDEYVFLVGFNEGLIPKYYKDDLYITDNVCELVKLDTTKILNKKLETKILNNLGDIKNLTITYKNSDYKKSYYPSNLVNHYKVDDISINKDITYSTLYDKIRLVKMYDEYYKYGNIMDDFGLLNSNYKINYNSYDNRYTGINSKMDKLSLSYSKLNIYNKCAFRYYLANVLKLDIFDENFSTVIGNMVHFVMEEALKNNENDIDKFVNIFLQDKVLSKKEKFFLDKYIISIKELLNQVILEKEYGLFDHSKYEEKIDIKISDNIYFTGIIDKVLYYNANNHTYIALVDYKTGNDDISLKYLENGIDIQLPIYLYLSKYLGLDNLIYVGFYLQKLNINKKDYRLVGYTNSDEEIIPIIDNNYSNSKIIKGLKTNKDGSFSKNAKILSNDEINEIINKTETIIKDTINNILNNKFDINPKVDGDDYIGCEYCKFKDICFKTYNDIVKINATKEVGE